MRLALATLLLAVAIRPSMAWGQPEDPDPEFEQARDEPLRSRFVLSTSLGATLVSAEHLTAAPSLHLRVLVQLRYIAIEAESSLHFATSYDPPPDGGTDQGLPMVFLGVGVRGNILPGQRFTPYLSAQLHQQFDTFLEDTTTFVGPRAGIRWEWETAALFLDAGVSFEIAEDIQLMVQVTFGYDFVMLRN